MLTQQAINDIKKQEAAELSAIKIKKQFIEAEESEKKAKEIIEKMKEKPEQKINEKTESKKEKPAVKEIAPVKITVDDLANFCKSKGFVFRSSDIYGVS